MNLPSFLRPRRTAVGLAVALALAGCGGAPHDASAATGAQAPAAAAPATPIPAPPPAGPSAAPGGSGFASRNGELSNPDGATMVFLYDDLAGIAPPLEDWTERDARVQFAPGPDKAAHRAQVHAELAAGARAVHDVGVLHLTLQANLSDYDPSYQEFTVRALSPSSQVPFEAFGQRVQLSFDNALDAQSWHVPTADAQRIRDRIDQRDVVMDLTAKIDKVQPGPAGGAIVARVLHYELRESNGDTTLARVDVPVR